MKPRTPANWELNRTRFTSFTMASNRCAAPRDEVRARLRIAPHDLVIGFVGRLVPQKGPELLLRALPLVLHRRPQVKLLIVGDGPVGPGMRREVEQQGLASRVLLLGDQLAAPLMPAFDIFCLPSRYEGMPYVLLEALAAGLPLVASRVGGVTTCVEEGHNGFVVPVADESRLAEALVLLAGDCATAAAIFRSVGRKSGPLLRHANGRANAGPRL